MALTWENGGHHANKWWSETRAGFPAQPGPPRTFLQVQDHQSLPPGFPQPLLKPPQRAQCSMLMAGGAEPKGSQVTGPPVGAPHSFQEGPLIAAQGPHHPQWAAAVAVPPQCHQAQGVLRAASGPDTRGRPVPVLVEDETPGACMGLPRQGLLSRGPGPQQGPHGPQHQGQPRERCSPHPGSCKGLGCPCLYGPVSLVCVCWTTAPISSWDVTLGASTRICRKPGPPQSPFCSRPPTSISFPPVIQSVACD